MNAKMTTSPQQREKNALRGMSSTDIWKMLLKRTQKAPWNFEHCGIPFKVEREKKIVTLTINGRIELTCNSPSLLMSQGIQHCDFIENCNDIDHVKINGNEASAEEAYNELLKTLEESGTGGSVTGRDVNEQKLDFMCMILTNRIVNLEPNETLECCIGKYPLTITKKRNRIQAVTLGGVKITCEPISHVIEPLALACQKTPKTERYVSRLIYNLRLHFSAKAKSRWVPLKRDDDLAATIVNGEKPELVKLLGHYNQ